MLSRDTPLLHTSRATLRMATKNDISAILRFYTENAAHFAPTDPHMPDGFYTEPFWIERIAHRLKAWSSEQALSLFIFESETQEIVGSITLSQMCRGPFQAFYLGYSLDSKREGTGLMRESLEAVIRFAFQDLNFHRIMANHLPENKRSA
ncbi:MAG: GNAT family N-acetyltransferase, partial [Bdellovibrionota bacterium]